MGELQSVYRVVSSFGDVLFVVLLVHLSVRLEGLIGFFALAFGFGVLWSFARELKEGFF